MRILRGQKEQTIAVKLGKFPSGKELAKVESGKPAEPRHRAGSARPDAWRPAPARQGRRRRSPRSTVLRRRPEGHQVGRRDPRGRRPSVKTPEDVVQRRQGSREARPQGRPAAHQVRRPDALRRRAAQEGLRTRFRSGALIGRGGLLLEQVASLRVLLIGSGLAARPHPMIAREQPAQCAHARARDRRRPGDGAVPAAGRCGRAGTPPTSPATARPASPWRAKAATTC